MLTSQAAPQRSSMALTDMDDAETVELLSQDSCSTLSSVGDANGGCPDVTRPAPGNAEEARLRHRTLHDGPELPELKPQPAWLEDPGDWAAAHVDHFCIAVRWRVTLPSAASGTAAAHATAWVPYAVPLAHVSTRAGGGAAPGADTANTAVSTTSSSRSARAGRPLGTALLFIGRSALLLAAQISSLPPAASDAAALRDGLVDAGAAVSRAQCAVHLHLTAPSAARLVCRSFDLFAIAPTTALHGVALQPHQRYHIKRGEAAGSGAGGAACADDNPCSADGVLTLRLGPLCHVDIALDGVPPTAPPSRVSGSAGARLSSSAVPTATSSGSAGTRTTATWSGHTQDELAVHRTAARDRHVAAAVQLRRGSTTSLLNGDSTAVLATLSNVSEPVALSGASDEEDEMERIDRAPVESASASTAAAAVDVPARAPSPASAERVETQQQQPRPRRRAAAAAIERAAPAGTAKRSRTAAPTAPPVHEAPAVVAVPHFSPLAATPTRPVVFTTGIRLSDADEGVLREIGVLVNPSLRFAPHARFLVAQRPLVRSVKLLTVLPYVQDVVHQSWLDTVLHTRTVELPATGFAYGERKIAGSIESDNGFDLRETLARPPAERQRLFASLQFWVHRSATPQEAPMNDLKTVLLASGGAITGRLHEADVVVLPQQKPTLPCWRGMAQLLTTDGSSNSAAADTESAGSGGAQASGMARLAQLRQAGVVFVVPGDVFKCVLQQRRPTTSVVIPRQLLAETSTRTSARATTCSTRRSSQAPGKTPRSSTNALSSPRTSTLRRRR